MLKRLLMLTVMLGLFAVPLFTSSASAGVAPSSTAKTAVEFCKFLDDIGVLAETGQTLGECVNIVKGPSSPQANNFIAGLCSFDFVLVETGTTNKGQCIKVVNAM